MALASLGPIQIGNTRVPSFSCRMTTGVFEVRSRPRLWTFTSIMRPPPNPDLWSYLQSVAQIRDVVIMFPGKETEHAAIERFLIGRPSEMAVRRGWSEDRIPEPKYIHD